MGTIARNNSWRAEASVGCEEYEFIYELSCEPYK